MNRAQPEAVGGATTTKPPLRLPVIGPGAEAVEPRVLGQGVLRRLDAAFQRLDAGLTRFLPADMNPFAQTGAIANTTFIVAAVSGVLLLIWYKTSVHQAYDSVVAMTLAPLTSGFVRTLHRYSSDACLFFVLVHALKLTAARRFGGARWLAWVTGILLVGTLWFVGWTGYWLVWDERAQRVALGTARMLDVLPIFADPLSRSFLADESVNSLLFFAIFFVHMLVPLAMGIPLWLHITRLSRSQFLTTKRMTWWVLGALALMSLALPADVAGPARMAAEPDRFTMDWWYLMPLAFTDRLGAGALWAIVLFGGALLFPVPWLVARGRARPAEVIPARCNACEKCYQDCPYDAIAMVPRSDDAPYPSEARVNPDKCVGCGICAGSCDSAGVGVWWFSEIEQRKRMDRQIAAAAESGDAPLLALICGESAGASLTIDDAGVCNELPGYRAVRVPCAGWVHPLTVERALRRGARGVLVVACGPGGCRYREGGKWTAQRLSGAREPSLRTDKVDAQKVRLLELFRTEGARLRAEAAAFARARPPVRPHRPSPARAGLAGVVLALALVGVIWGATRVGYAAPALPGSELVVSFKHPGQSAEQCREPSAEEIAKLPPHMRPKTICERRRADVRLVVTIDGQERVDRAFEPRGIWHDGNSIAIERIPVTPGRHDVRIRIGDTPDGALRHEASRNVSFREGHRSVVLFDKLSGFTWHE